MRWEHRGRVAVIGVGFSSLERRAARPIGSFASEAAAAALADCGLEPAAIDGLATYPAAVFAGAQNRDGQDIVAVESFLKPYSGAAIRWYSQAGEGLIAASVRDAVNALLARACRYVLVWRATYFPAPSYPSVASREAAGDSQFTDPYGCVSPVQWHALAYRRYLERHRESREQLAALAVTSRRNAHLHPYAIFRDRPLSTSDYAAGRLISSPLCLFDCDVPVTGCVCLVLTTADRAGTARHPPAYIAAVAQQTHPHGALLHYTLQDYLDCGRSLTRQLWSQSGLTAGDVDAAQLYDGFAPSVLYWLEAAGFCRRGEALSFIQDGRIALDGELPLNTFGGSLSQGRLHGMGHIAEAVEQVRGSAGPRQLPRANTVLVLDGSPMLRGGGLLLTSTPL